MRILSCCFIAFMVSVVPALEIEPPLPQERRWQPTIKVPPSEQPVRLTSMSVDVHIDGLLVETKQTMRFSNPNNRILSGELQLPLPDGATVCGYALNIGERMVDGVVVGKQKARVILDTETRRRVDPGLVEHVRGNIFKTRVYPIPARGSRTISVTWVSQLPLREDAAAFHLPLPKTTLNELNLKIAIRGDGIKPEIGGFGDMTLTSWKDGWQSQAQLKDIEPGEDLWVKLPKLPQQIVSLEAHDHEHFLALIDRPVLPQQTQFLAPKHFAVAWDASGSRDSKTVAQEITSLVAAMRRWPGSTCHLQVFRNDSMPVKVFNDAAALQEYLQALPYDGATDLSVLDFRRQALPHVDCAFWLLVSDGLHTLGTALPASDSVTVHCVSASQLADRALQDVIAGATGGRSLDLRHAQHDMAQLLMRDIRLLRVDAEPGVLADAHIVSRLEHGYAACFARVLKAGTVKLVYGRAGQETHRTEHKLDPTKAASGRLVARAWAGRQAQSLAVFPDDNREALIALGNAYNLVTPGTSLLVLESLDQYLRHKVEPPASWPEMHKQYLASHKQRRGEVLRRQQHKINQVLGWWKMRKDWYARDFSVTKVAVKADKDDRGEAEAGQGSPGRRAAWEFSNGPRDAAAPRQQLGVAPVADASPEAPAAMEEVESDRRFAGGRGMALARVASPRKKGGKEGERSTAAGISITAWNPNTPYLRAMQAVDSKGRYAVYLQQRSEYQASPAFFLDCAGLLLKDDRNLGLRVLSNLAEMKIEDARLMRVFAWRLQEAGQLDRAIEVLTKVKNLRPEEPQSHRDLGLLLSLRYDRDSKRDDAVAAAKLFYDVISGKWQRFAQIELPALMELGRLHAKARAGGVPDADFAFIDSRLKDNLACDVRIVLSWDADVTDIDLHVVEPSGERAYYSHNRTRIGGLVSRDFTQGYGPEEYLLKKAMPGRYKIQCHYYGSAQQSLIGPATVTATVITNWGRADEKRQVLTLRLDKPNDRITIGSVDIGEGSGQTVKHVKRSAVEALQKGMSQDEVIKALGLPERREQAGIPVLVYRLESGSAVRLGFGPKLLWARLQDNGAERELLVRR